MTLITARAVAIVGSGPAGFFAAAALLDLEDVEVHVDMYERLVTPSGLVRAGVAPDHPKIKRVAATFDKTAEHERFRFFGNVELGTHVHRDDLLERYDAVLYTVGASAERRLQIPGEDLPGSVGALDFVAWYNGHPDFADHEFDLGVKRAVVIGNGNVALDVARILASPRSTLASTDIAEHALEALVDNAVEEVVVIGRRGPVEAAFTTAEVAELGEMTQAEIVVEGADLHEIDIDAQAPMTKRMLHALEHYVDQEQPRAERRVVLRFRTSPVEILGEEKVTGIVLGRNQLHNDGERVVARDTGEREELEAGLVVRAVGYRGVALPGVPFDSDAAVVPNVEGRVSGGEREYVAGWIKRGPSGVIGTNKKDARETVAHLADDLRATPASRGVVPVDTGWLEERQPDLVPWSGWTAIDEHERAAGEPHGRPRVKVSLTETLLEIARAEQAEQERSA